jgi:RNA polymerase sigma-70 factor (ECF subfamily)
VDRQAALDRARAGDTAALGELLGNLRPYVRLLVRTLRRGRAPARFDDSDLVQDALLEAHRGFAAFQGRTVAEFTSWLRTIVRRTVGRTLRDHLETSKRAAGREEGAGGLDAVAAAESTPSQSLVRDEQAAEMAAALARLPDAMQQVLLGRHVDGLSHAELAARLGRSEQAVRVLYTRALRRLREEYREEPP